MRIKMCKLLIFGTLISQILFWICMYIQIQMRKFVFANQNFNSRIFLYKFEYQCVNYKFWHIPKLLCVYKFSFVNHKIYQTRIFAFRKSSFFSFSANSERAARKAKIRELWGVIFARTPVQTGVWGQNFMSGKNEQREKIKGKISEI